ncbi:S-layer homology domain-containing protein [Paenibacillus sp. HWE-109]|uniref:S-layer homology domain-containing protein n=1 Tax=Paenibacillus sp. HWE-109 TaxID=1306526 RepID=UPI001EDFBC80|nr:S-layer homology domain-containing protein [Paenibacillus sp. HWE-109]UKS27100.1 S-layer homology domain-containing protein [Paenibacillus sp. HWE-109]
MRAIRKCLAILIFVTLVMNFPLAVLADGLNAKDVTVLSNSFIKVTVDNHSGRFAIRTVDGQPVRKNDQQVDMMFRGDDPESSFTTFRIDGTDYIFGNPYKFGVNFLSEVTPPKIVNNTDGTRQIETVWTIKGVEIKQIIMLYMDVKDKKNSGNVNVRYEVTNHSGADIQVGSRMLLDTMVGGNDGPAFQVGTAYKVPLQVERKLVDESKLDGSISPEEKPLYTLPAYWVMKDKYDLTNPLATNVVAYGFNNFSEKDINIVDEMIVGHWNKMANTKWDYQVNPNLDFTTDTNDYGTADSAVALYWNPDPVLKEATKTFETVYGLGEIVEPDKVFSIRYIDPVNQLATTQDGSAYDNEGVFNVVAEIENLPAFQMEQSRIDAELQLANGLKFVDLDERGQIKRDGNGHIMTKTSDRSSISFKKEATPEEAQNGIQPKFKPGETVTASFKVVAKGKAWPTTKEYMLTASSPETELKLENVKDESIKAQYTSNKANFVFLPAVGQGSQTFVYAMSPKEAYTTDVKYITLNLSNIEAYTTGNATADPNFDLYLKESATGHRYKVPVKNSVILQPTGDGLVGDMRITYRTGDLVDTKGVVMKDADGKEMRDLGAALPLGEYQVEIDYKGDSGDDPDGAKLYDITTSQRFVVSENEEARVKKANLLAVVKKMVNLGQGLTDATKKELEEAYPGYTANGSFQTHKTLFNQVKGLLEQGSKLADPELDLTTMLPEARVPAYRLVAFESEEELDTFKEKAEQTHQEVLVEIEGMINRIGSGNEAKYVVDTKSEPAIINKSVAYRGKDMVFSNGQLDVLGLVGKIPGYKGIPFFNTLNVKGDGLLTVASSGFVFHQGEWTLDFFNGFDKSLAEGEKEEKADKGGEDESLNGSLKWAAGELGDRLNPLRQLLIHDVYFNKHSLFAAPSFSISGFGLKFNDFILREDGVSFGGSIAMKIADAEIKNVKFNDKGFVGIDADLKFELSKSMGLIDSSESEGEDEKLASGEFNLVHYEQKQAGVENKYDLNFDANLRGITQVHVEIAFKQVADKRILPNVIAFSADLGDPGVLIAGGTYLTSVRGAIRELADTIAGGSSDVPLTIEAGADVSFGVKPATFYGSIDMTLRRSGIKLVGRMDYRASSTSDRVEMLKEATVSAQWMTPWFVSASAEIDVMGWDLIIGKASIFLGQNLLKNRIDFEGFVSARVQVPGKVPILGGMSLGGVSLGANNDKMWGGVSILFFSLGITYYFNGGVEFGTSGEGLPEGLLYLQVQDPETGPKLVVFGEGVQTMATSWVSQEDAVHEIQYHSVAEGVEMLDNGSMNVGIGGIKVADEGKLHEIPMNKITGDALLELTYNGLTAPNFVFKDNNGKDFKLIYDETRTNAQANAFTQQITTDGVSSKKVYIAIPHDRIGGSIWKLYADQAVESKLLNIPQAAQLDEIKLDPSQTDANKFTATWKVNHAKPGDTVSLYLTKDAVSDTKQAFNEEIKAPGDTGLIIAKDLKVANLGGLSGSVTSGQTEIDVTKVPLLGDTEDIRGLLSQGNYYLRAELKSASTFQTKTTKNKFDIIDPLAPSPVSDVTVKPAGNGYFELSFKPAGRKLNQTDAELSYAIDVLQEANGKLGAYPNFASQQWTEAELAPYWNKTSGKYEHIRLGGWTANSNSSQVNQASLAGQPVEGKIKYTGLEVGQSYVVGVSAAAKPSKAADKHQNDHYAERVNTASTLLPVPSKPKLTAQVSQAKQLSAVPSSFLEVLTNQKEQSITITSDQKNVEVEAIYDDKSIGIIGLADQSTGSTGKLQLTTFKTDGKYAIELRTRNKTTGDYSVTMLYLTVDTMAPVIYIDTPLTGERTKNGKIKVSGTTSNDATLKVNGQSVAVSQNGKFEGEVAAVSSDATFTIAFEASDLAGNSNKASVMLTNGAFQVPVALVLRKVPNLKVNESAQVKAYLRMANGKNEVEADASKLTFTNYLGEAISVTGNGAVKALKVGAGIAKAEYKLSDEMSLQAMTVINVESTIIANTAEIANNGKATKLNIISAGDLTDAALVYRLYPKSEGTPVAPVYQDDVSGWLPIPADGIIPAVEGDKLAVAKQPKGGKLNIGVTGLMPAAIWTVRSGGPGGGGMPPANSDIRVGGEKIASDRKDDRIYAKITDSLGMNNGKATLLIQSEDKTANGYEFDISQTRLAQAVNSKQTISFELPFAELSFPAAAAVGIEQDLKVKIDKNSSSVQNSFRQIANELQANVLGDGQGASFDLPLPNGYKDRSVNAKVAIPANVNAKEITAVVVRDANGNWTTVPWKLEVVHNQPYVSLTLTGSGSVAFFSNHKNFVDVDEQDWAKQTISEAAGQLFMLGRTADRFDPNLSITRAEYPTVLLRVLGLMNQQAVHSFADINQEDWYNRSVAIAADQGIVNGFQDGTYKPNEELSRMEAMIMVSRSLKLIGANSTITESQVNETLGAFKDDASIPDWAREAVALCIKAGIITGQDQSINPAAPLTRAQAAAIAMRLSHLMVVSNP